MVQFWIIQHVIPNPRKRARAFTSARVGVRDLVSLKIQTVPLPASKYWRFLAFANVVLGADYLCPEKQGSVQDLS